MRRPFIFSSFFIMLFLLCTTLVSAQNNQSPTDDVDIKQLILEIEKNPEDLSLHEKYLKASGFTKWGAEENQEFVQQYERWIKKYPNSATLYYALGHAYAGKESPKAKKYLLRAVEIDPKFDKAYYDLWIDGERWGDFKVSREYLAKAKEANPSSADYAFYYANGFSDSDPEKYKTLSLEVANKFPNTERGAQALYWLGNRSEDVNVKTMAYEKLLKEFAPNKFRWSASGMSSYFDLLLTIESNKAIELAQTMIRLNGQDDKTWNANLKTAKNINEAQKLLHSGKAVEAVAFIEQVAVPRWSSSKGFVLSLKSTILDAAGKTATAYQNLLEAFVKEPTGEMHDQLIKYGDKLGKNAKKINDDIWFIRDTAAKVAPDFTMETYMTKGKTSLSDYKGKVVLLTYWFPGCGPCRGEFPHFENVVRKFKGKDLIYLGINIVPEQDEYVVPFMKSSGYSFTPIKDHKNWEKGPLDNRNAAPVNFLIDPDGNIIFSRFRTDGSNEETLELMIKSLLERNKNA